MTAASFGASDAVAAALLFVAALFPLRWSETRFAPFAFGFLGCVTFPALGPRAAVLSILTGALAAAVFWFLRRRFGRIEARARSLSTLGCAIAIAIGIGAAHVFAQALGLPYPLPVGPFSNMLVQVKFWGAIDVLALIALALSQAFERVVVRPPEEDPRLARVEPPLPSVLIAGITSAPLTYAAQVVYDPHALLPWAIALSWIFLLNAAFARQIERRRKIGALMDELATKERLAAVGEVSARVVHQTRHQLGLIGITVHRIAKRLSSLSGEDAAVVREELEKLGDVQRELSDMLTGVLRQTRAGDGAPPPPSTYADLVSSVAKRLDALAVSRGVRLTLGDLSAARRASPAHPDNVADAIFNVLENALVAAHAEVVVATSIRGDLLVVSVTDDGPGMPDSVLSRISVSFVTTKADGTGMWLAIARAAVSGERGALKIANGDDGGCVVEIAVPMRAA